MAAQKRPSRRDGYPAVRPTVDQLITTQKQFRRVSADFLKADLETALTFCQIARNTDSEARQQRNRRSARKAYDTISRLLAKTEVSDADARFLKQNMKRLKSQLKGLGEVF